LIFCNKMDKKTWIIIALLAVLVVAIILLFNQFDLTGNVIRETSSEDNPYIPTNNINEVKVEFVPNYIEGINCDAGESCNINFQIKNIGDKRIYVTPGTFEDGADFSRIIYLSVGGSNSAHLAPGETSQTLTINAFGNANLDQGDYQIKIPLQIYDESGKRVGESNYYLNGAIHYNNRPYCCSQQQIEKGYCNKVAVDNCRALSCSETNNIPPCYG